MNQPFFSVIIPTYNRGDLILQTIESVLQQEFKDFELLIVDDGSTDNTEQVISGISDSRIQYFKKKNEERGAARNFGGMRAKGNYITFLDSDDLFYNNHLQVAVNFIKGKKNSAIFFQQYEIRYPNGEKRVPFIPKNDTVNDQLVKKGNFMSCHGVFVKRDVFSNNLFNEDRRLAGSEDYELWLRMASRFPIYYSPIITNALVEHSGRSVVNMNTGKIIERKKRMLKYLFEDKMFVEKYGYLKAVLESDAYSYIALHQVLNNERKKAFKYLLKAIISSPLILFRKRTLVVLFRLFSR